MPTYRLADPAVEGILAILTWSHEQFGEDASDRYEALIAAAFRDAASGDHLGRTPRPELGDGVFSWHLAQSRDRVRGDRMRHPRHFLICRWDADVLVVGHILHEAMDLQLHVDSRRNWD